ncbi:MAG: ROK family protein [Candidatus Omnitrophota bacterium]|nr:ROK family protein [Candidatus Omnitrophota bacterium]
MKREGVFSFHILQDRERKNLAILELIRKKGPISRADISRVLGFNIVTVTNYTDYYIDKRIILEVGLDVSSGGRRPELLELNSRSAYIIGVDLGPNNIIAIVTDLKVKTIAKSVMPRPAYRMEDLASEVIKVIDDVIKKSKIEVSNIKNIGIGVSGIVDYPSSTIHDTDPTRGRTKVSFLSFENVIGQKFDIPVYIGNDASCAAFGEKVLNPSADVDNLIYLYSDVGCGLVMQGDVYIGSSGCAGETQLALEGLQTEEKNYMKEFTYLRPWGVDLAITHEAKKAVEKGMATEMLSLAKGDPKAITRDTVIDAAKKGDKLATEIIGNAGKNLGVRVAFMVNVLNPDIVIVGGGVEKAGDILMDPVKATMRKLAFEEPAGIVKVVPSLLGEDAVVLGAAALAAREIFIQA